MSKKRQIFIRALQTAEVRVGSSRRLLVALVAAKAAALSSISNSSAAALAKIGVVLQIVNPCRSKKIASVSINLAEVEMILVWKA